MLRLVLVLIVAVCSFGCTSVRPSAPEATLPPDPRAVSAYDGDSGQRLVWDEVLARINSADVVIIGENHGHTTGLSVAAALWEDVLERADRPALSLEFFSRDDQTRIDDYLAGLTDEATFKRRTGRVDGNYPPEHRAMLEAAKTADRPVIAANAPRTLVRFVNRYGFDQVAELTPEQQRMVRVPDELPAGRYRQEFESLMRDSIDAAHGIDDSNQAVMERMIEGMFRAQALWDWTMADSITRAAEQGEQPVVHVVGRFHSDFRGGLVQALERLLPGANILTITMAPAWSDGVEDDDLGRADIVIYAGPAS